MSQRNTQASTSIKDAEDQPDGLGLASLLDLERTWTLMGGRQAARGRRMAVGIDGVRADVFARDLARNLREIERRICRRDANGETSYALGPLARRVLITPRGKARKVHVPRLRDQIVLRLVMEDLAGAMQRIGIPVAAPSQRAAALRLTRELRSGRYAFVVRADVASFYESIPHAPLIRLVNQVETHLDTRTLVRRLLQCPIREPLSRAGSGTPMWMGVPTGVSVASVLGELYLSELDQSLREIDGAYHRYVDDLLVLCETDAAARIAEEAIRTKVQALGLRLSESKVVRCPISDGPRFIGLRLTAEGPVIDQERIDRWAITKRRLIRNAARAIATAATVVEREALLEDLVRSVNRDVSGVTGRLVPLLSRIEQPGQLAQLDDVIRTALGGIFRRNGAVPAGRFRLASAVEWGHRWRASPKKARAAAVRLFGAPA